MISYNDIKQIFYAISWTPMETTRQYSWEMVKMVKIFVMQPMNLCINFLKKKFLDGSGLCSYYHHEKQKIFAIKQIFLDAMESAKLQIC